MLFIVSQDTIMAEAVTASKKDMIKAGLHAIKRLPIARRNSQVTPPPSLRLVLDYKNMYADLMLTMK